MKTAFARLSIGIALLISLVIPMSTFAYTSPGKPTGFVNDFANVLSTEERNTLGQKLLAFSQSTGNEIVVVTIPTLNGESIEDYALALYREWGIGSKEKNNGMLILAAINDRELRIEVGYGLEGAVTDAQAGVVIRKIITPAFQTGNYFTGLSRGADALLGLISKDPSVSQAIASAAVNEKPRFSINNVFIFLFFILLYGLRILSSSRSWWLGGVCGAALGVGIAFLFGYTLVVGSIIAGVLAVVGLIIDYFVSKSGGGGRGGGFGGFGGGSSGGGGASGKW